MKEVIRETGRAFANLQWILKPCLTVLAFLQLSRVAFILKNPKTLEGLSPEDISEFVLLCIRFDSSLFFTLFLLFFVLLVLPLPSKVRRWFIRPGFTLTAGIFFLPELVDVFFFSFNGRRLDFPALRFLGSDALRQVPQLTIHYPLVPIAVFLMLFVIWKSFPRMEREGKSSGWLAGILAACLITAGGIMVIRNSFGQKPLLPGNAFVLHPSTAGHAALNTGFVLFKTLESPRLEKAGFLPEKEYENLVPACLPDTARFRGCNVVLIILESFATEYTGLEPGGAGQTPFLDSLAGAGIWFPHHFASGRTSRDALPSILSSIPAWMDESFAGSPYVSARVEGIGTSLSDAGYQTRFFHGGKNGTMSFDLISRLSGFSDYTGLNEYPDQSDFDGNWGIFDGPFLHFAASEMQSMRQPFAACIFTLSSHQPYRVPEGWKDDAGSGGNPVFRAVRYADQSLREFFRIASRMPWYRNTLFVLTADHTHEIFSPAFKNYEGMFDVPLLVFSPLARPRADTSRFIQHTDIRMLVLEMLGKKPKLKNQLSPGIQNCKTLFPMQYQDGQYHLIHPMGRLSWDGKNPQKNWSWISPGSPEPAGLRTQMMARLQYFRNGLIEDRLFH